MAAKKDKQARRLARKRKGKQPKGKQPKGQQRTQSSGQDVLLKRVQSSEHLKNTKVIQSPRGTEKMSDVIHRFAAPLQDKDGDVSRTMIIFAILVWNASLLPKDKQTKAIEDIIESLPNSDIEFRKVSLLAMNMLLERKEKYFSDNKRLIIDYHITETNHRMNLDVASTLPEGYNPEL